MQDAIYNTVSWAQNLANKPYAPYEGPRIAGFTPTEQAGMRAAVGTAGAFEPYLGAATGALGEAAGVRTAGMIGGGGPSGAAAAQPYLGQAAGMSAAGVGQPYFQKGAAPIEMAGQGSALGAAQSMLGRAAGMSAVGSAQPYLERGVSPIELAGQGSALGAAQSMLGRAIGASPLAAAQPYLSQAGRSFPGAVEEYMNPYTKNVVNRIADLGVRQLQEKFLPEIGEEFIRAGQFGGSRMGEFGARALRDVQESVLAEQAKALQAGYGQAADIFSQEQTRQAQLAATAGQLGGAQQRALLEAGQTTGQLSTSDLQRLLSSGVSLSEIGERFGALSAQDASRLADIGTTMGQLSTSDLNRLLQSGVSLSEIGQRFGALTAQDASRLADIGATAGQLTGQDAQRALSAEIARAEAAGMDVSNLKAIAQQYGGLGEAAQTLGLRGAAAITGVGAAERELGQQALDLAYQQYKEETRYPYEQLGFQAGIIGGFPASSTGTTQTQSTIEKPVEPSDLSKILGSLAGATALYKTWKGT